MKVSARTLNFILSAALLSAGCASIIHGTMQSVPFNSNPVGAQVTVIDDEGFKIANGTSPCVLTLKRGNEYKVTIEKEGYAPFSIVLKRRIDGWYWGNIALIPFGMIGVVIDIANGAAYKLSPKEVQISLTKSGSSQIDHEAILVLDYERLSADLKAKLVRLY